MAAVGGPAATVARPPPPPPPPPPGWPAPDEGPPLVVMCARECACQCVCVCECKCVCVCARGPQSALVVGRAPAVAAKRAILLVVSTFAPGIIPASLAARRLCLQSLYCLYCFHCLHCLCCLCLRLCRPSSWALTRGTQAHTRAPLGPRMNGRNSNCQRALSWRQPGWRLWRSFGSLWAAVGSRPAQSGGRRAES